MAQHRAILPRARLSNHGPALAEQLFDLMTKFAEYGFNKSHTAAYAVVSYQTAWLKAHHCAAFAAATMSSELDNTDQLQVFYEDVLANKLKMLPPDVNQSFYRFVPVSRKGNPLRWVRSKGTGEAAVEHIVAERARNGPRAVHQRSVRFLQAHRQAHGQQARDRGLDPRRRVRQHRRSRQTAGQCATGAGSGRADCQQRQPGRLCSTCSTICAGD